MHIQLLYIHDIGQLIRLLGNYAKYYLRVAANRSSGTSDGLNVVSNFIS